ncbi:MAG TPA: hypothetical protein VKY19_10520 [Ktedonosporobacter sp.]|nr:hypothetical protein [Ktedonosporobacter sp.]
MQVAFLLSDELTAEQVREEYRIFSDCLAVTFVAVPGPKTGYA